MASIKNLKKQIKYLINDLKDECILYLAIHQDMKAGDIAAIIREIDEISAGLLFQLNHWNYKPSELSARQFIDVAVSEARKKMDSLLVKLPQQQL